MSGTLTDSLNKDCLEWLAQHAHSVHDLLSLSQTCKTFAELLRGSEKAWVARLRSDFGLALKALPSNDTLFVRIARHVYEATRSQSLRYQAVLVTGGVDEDAMRYWADNLLKPNRAPYCSACSANADVVALLLDGEVPRDTEYEKVRRYMIRRCRYAAALIMNVQIPEHGRDPEAVINILEDWTDGQLERFFRDLVGALAAEHALGRLLVFDIPHARLPAERQRIEAVDHYLLNRLRVMKQGMLKPPGAPNVIFDTTVMPKLKEPAATNAVGVVHELTLSRTGYLTCPVSSGVVMLGSLDFSRLRGLSAEQVSSALQAASVHASAAAFNSLGTSQQVEAAAAAGRLPPIVATDETMAGLWHEFGTSAALGSGAGASGDAVKAAPSPEAAATAAAAAAAAAAPNRTKSAQAAAQAAAASAAVVAAAASEQAAKQAAPLVTWRPLVWFRFHSAGESQAFVRQHRELVARWHSAATVRHRGPAPAAAGHQAAGTQPEQQQQQDQQQQQQEQQQQQQQQQPGEVRGQEGRDASAAQQQEQQEADVVKPMASAAPLPVQRAGDEAGSATPPPTAPAAAPQAAAAAPAAAGGSPEGAATAAGQGGEHNVAPEDRVLGFASAMAQQQYEELGADLMDAERQAPSPQQQEQGALPLAGGTHPTAGSSGSGVAPLAARGGSSGGSGSSVRGSESGGSASESGSSGSGSESEGDSEEEGPPVGPHHPAAWIGPWLADEFGEDLEQGQEPVVAGEGIMFDHMGEGDEEGGSSEEEEDGGGMVLEAAFGEAAGAAAAANAADAAVVRRRGTRGRCKLHVTLTKPCSGNVLLVKLIDQENLMQAYGDEHGWPNIDMAYVGLSGKMIRLPPGIDLAP